MNAEAVEQIIRKSQKAFQDYRNTSRFLRSEILRKMATEIESQRAAFVELLIKEAKKPRPLSEIEVTRAITTFTVAHEEAKRLGGEAVPMDIDPSSEAFEMGLSAWVPRGPVLAITPFNFPLNLVAHKVAPALAVGASIVVKPAPQAPGCAILLQEIFTKIAGARFADVVQTHLIPHDFLSAAIKDPRLSVLSFTGSDRVGWMLQGMAIRKKVLLELGGNAGVIVHSDGDLPTAAKRCAVGAFAYAGQTCISVQRIFVQNKVYERFMELFLKETKLLKCGDPKESDVTVGPVIDEGAADRIERWISEAKALGARDLTETQRRGNLISPAVLVDVPPSAKVNCEEVFGPVAVISPYETIDQAIDKLNNSRFGLQAGLYTQDLSFRDRAFRDLEVGALVINDIPTFRADHMPYGGVKDSGLGREGLHYAMEDFCERRFCITKRL